MKSRNIFRIRLTPRTRLGRSSLLRLDFLDVQNILGSLEDGERRDYEDRAGNHLTFYPETKILILLDLSKEKLTLDIDYDALRKVYVSFILSGQENLNLFDCVIESE